MIFVKKIGFLLIITGYFLLLSSCQMGRSHYMTKEQHQRLNITYDSLQTTYKDLMDRYDSTSDSVRGQIQSLYAQMQRMHREMQINHRQTMGMDRSHHMRGDHMMAKGMGMHMQSHMTGEWYRQMMSMHQQMAAIHNQQEQKQMAEMNRRLFGHYGRMMHMIPGLDEPTEISLNEDGNPALLDGGSLYSRNCASCHGSDATGIAGVFPPLVNTEWVTGKKSVPIRILLHGLTGKIEVNNRTYQGIMPSFKARLSATEMAVILNYLRSLSETEVPEITQNDIIRVNNMYDRRTQPWSASELADE